MHILKMLFFETYLKDFKECYNIRKDDNLEELINIMAFEIASLTNPNKLANTFQIEKKSVISYDTIKDYIDYLCDSFKKIIIIGEESPVTRDESGITTISIYDFLLKDNSLEL